MAEFDIGFTKDNCWFRLRAAAVIIEDGCILFAGNDKDNYYYSVGGGVHHGETTEQAVIREVFEETGVNYQIERLAFIHENFFVGEENDSLNGLNCHELTFYYLMKPRGTEKFKISCENGVCETMHWLPIDKLSEYRAFPTFFRNKLKNLGETVEHIITIE